MDAGAPEPTLVILAAGASARSGGTPKALFPVDGMPAIRRIAAVGARVGIRRFIAVLGADAPVLEAALRGAGVEIVLHPDWALGRTGSVQAGLSRLSPDDEALLWPVDHPFAEPKTVRILGSAMGRDALAVWGIPSFAGRGGHPVWIRPPAIARVLALPASAPLRSVLPSLGPQVIRIPVDDPGVVEGTDTLAEFLAAASRRHGGE